MEKDKNDKILEAINIIANEVNGKYKGLVDNSKIQKMYDKFKDSDKDLDEIVSEIKSMVEEFITEFNAIKTKIEQMMQMKMEKEKDKLSSLSNAKDLELNEQKINYLVIEQLDSKAAIKKYISDVCSQFPSINSQELLDKYDSIISDEQIKEVRQTLSEKYKTELSRKYADIRVDNPEDARNKLVQSGVDRNTIDYFTEKVANGERLEALVELEKKYGHQTVENLNETKTVTESEVEDATLDETNDQIYIKKKDNVKRLTLTNQNGFGFVAMLVGLVCFGIGVMSTLTYFVISSLVK